MPPGLGVLQRILEDLALSMQDGAAALHPILMGYLAFFGLLALVLTCYGLLWSGGALQTGMNLFMRLALVALALDNWPWFLGGLRELGLSLGLLGTGNQLQVTDFLDPGALVRLGMDSGAVLWKAFQNNLGWTSILIGLPYLLAWLGYMGAFAVMAYKVFWWQVELLIVGLGGLVLLPTLALRSTAFVAAGVLSYAANITARFLLGSLLVGALWKHLATLTAVARPVNALTLTTVDIKIQEAFYAVGLAWVLGATFFGVNKLCDVLTSGVPGMAGGNTLNGFLRTVGAGATALLTGGATVAAGGLAAARAGAAGVQGAIGAGRATAGGLALMQRSGGGAYGLGAAVGYIGAGAHAAASTGVAGRLAQYMGSASTVAAQSGQRTLHQLMSARQGSHDQGHSGVRR